VVHVLLDEVDGRDAVLVGHAAAQAVPSAGATREACDEPPPALGRDLSRDEAVLILDTAEEMSRLSDRAVKKLPTLRGRTVVEPVLRGFDRTRTSFEVAAKRLSADVINFSAKALACPRVRASRTLP